VWCERKYYQTLQSPKLESIRLQNRKARRENVSHKKGGKKKDYLGADKSFPSQRRGGEWVSDAGTMAGGGQAA
jgi:hypothetical protein